LPNGLPKNNSFNSNCSLLKFSDWINKPKSYSSHQFTFLNRNHKFNNENIEWGFSKYGKLWAYNLNYMDFLLQTDISKEEGVRLIELFVKQYSYNLTGKEPYPISLRGINWIKFFSKNSINNTIFNKSLFHQYECLFSNLEYHLLGNHLLENGFSLLFAAIYFNNEKFYKKANEIIRKELNEQILNDGGHFELSPMYHQIILDRLLDCINLVQNNPVFTQQNSLGSIMVSKAEEMISWIQELTFEDGEIPLLNDSTYEIAPDTYQLVNYAIRLGLNTKTKLKLDESGYRMVSGDTYECIVDIGHIGPDYIPGHAHADTLSFVTNVNNKPAIIDYGISTYEKNNQRQRERSTIYHNTVNIENENSSDVWGGFRVGKRARVTIIHDSNKKIIAEHNGYNKYRSKHNRTWLFDENRIIIDDIISSSGQANFLLAPNVTPLLNEHIVNCGSFYFEFQNSRNLSINKLKIPIGYSRFEETYQINVTFHNNLRTIINSSV
jgi:hypothetical protein